MVAINFSVFKDKILNGSKRQTIRLLNKKWCRVFDKTELCYTVMLQLYWRQRSKESELLMEIELRSLFPKKLNQITEKEAFDDGFKSLEELWVWFKKTYPKIDFEKEYLMIIKW